MDDLAALAEVLGKGGVVACPTETWLGLLDGAVSGVSPGGAPSTLIDTTTSPMRIIRPDAIEIDVAAL